MIWYILWAVSMGLWAGAMLARRYDMAIYFASLGLLFVYGSHSE